MNVSHLKKKKNLNVLFIYLSVKPFNVEKVQYSFKVVLHSAH